MRCGKCRRTTDDLLSSRAVSEDAELPIYSSRHDTEANGATPYANGSG